MEYSGIVTMFGDKTYWYTVNDAGAIYVGTYTCYLWDILCIGLEIVFDIGTK